MTLQNVAPGLNRIILVNSYIKTSENKIFEFNLNEHVQINGDNGAGKTSLIRLIPFFYGLEPGKITATGNNRKSFSGYYLPEDLSAIIFEYRNSRSELVHVLVTNASNNTSSTSLAYRFIPSAFNIEDFTIEESNGLFRTKTPEEYKKTLRAKGIKPSSLITTIDGYRAVIQNIPQDNNGQMRYDFSLSEGRFELKFIDRITHSLITRKVSFDNIKLLLSEIIKKDHTNLNLELREQDIKSFCNDISSFRCVDKLSDELKTIANDRDNLTKLFNTLSNDLFELHFHKNSISNKINEIEDKKNKLENQKIEFSKNHDLEIGALLSEKTAAQENIHRQKNYLNKLLTQKELYEKEDAATWSIKQNEITSLTKEISEDKETLKNLTGKVEEIKAQLEEKKEKYQKEFNNNLEITKNSLKKAKQNFDNQVQEINNTHNKNKHAIELKLSQTNYDFEIEVSKLEQKQNVITTQINNIAPNQNLTKETQELTIAISNIQAENDKNLKNMLNFLNEKSALEKESADLNEKLRLVKRKIQNILKQIKELDILSSNDENFLGGFLNVNIPNWQENIGKVLNHELLIKNDLNPRKISDNNFNTIKNSLSNDDTNIIIGNITLDISQITQNNSAKVFERELFTAKEEYKKLSQEEESLLKEIKNIESNIDNINNSIRRANNQLNNKSELENLLHRQNLLQERINEEKRAKKGELNKSLSSIENEILKINSEKEKALNNLNEQIKDLENSLTLNIKDLETSFSKENEQLNKQLDNLKNEHQIRIDEIDTLIKEKLAKNDIDTDIIDKILERIKTKENTLNDILAHKALAQEYDKWSTQYGDTINSERDKLNALNSALDLADESLKKQERIGIGKIKEFTNNIEEFNAQITSLEKDIKNINENLSLISNNDVLGSDYLENDEFKNELEKFNSQISVNNLLLNINERLKNFIKTRDNLSTNLKLISSSLFDYKLSGIYEMWNGAKTEDASQPLTKAPKEISRIIFEANAAVTLLEKILPNQRTLLIDNARNISHMINQYYYQLRNFDNRIKGFSQKISRIVSENLQFEAFNSFNIRLEPKIRTMASWEFIEAIANYYNEYVNEDAISGNLPDKQFTEKLQLLATKFENGQLQNDLNELFTVVFEIVEKGKLYKATTANELENLSSNGLNFLLMCAFYIGLIHQSRNEQNLNIHLPVDEMGALANENINRLIKVMNKNNIVMVSTVPNLSLTKHFKTIYRITPSRPEGVFVSINNNANSLFLNTNDVDTLVKQDKNGDNAND